MKVCVVGLGRMGRSIAYRLACAGYTVYGYDPYVSLPLSGLSPSVSLVAHLTDIIPDCTIFWLMVPAGDSVEIVCTTLIKEAPEGSIIIDAGNSYFKDSIRRAHACQKNGIIFLDCGTSGGLQGLDYGFCLMVGGNHTAYMHCIPLWQAISAPDGYHYCGPSGIGHYIKMVHNGIEYALLQAYAEGFHLLKEGYFAQHMPPLADIAQLWNSSAIIRSWILELIENALAKNPDFTKITEKIAEGGMGRWTVDEAHEYNIPTPLIEEACALRALSRKKGGNYATQLISLLRHEFGGHSFTKDE